MQQNEDVLKCKIFFPVTGRFKFELFARKGDDGQEEGKYDIYMKLII